MIFSKVKKLVSFGIRATRLDKKKTRAEINNLVTAGIIEARHAGRLLKAVLGEAAREQQVISAFLFKEAAKEYRKATPHARRAAERGTRLAKKVVSAATRLRRR